MINKGCALTEKELFMAKFNAAFNTTGVDKLVLAVRLPTGAKELIINDSNIVEKASYIYSAYDDEMKLKTNPQISIVSYMIVPDEA